MNDSQSLSQPAVTATGVPPLTPVLNPEDTLPITSATGVIEALLRQPRRLIYQLRGPGAGKLIFMMVLFALVFSLIYGFVVGTFSMKEQLWAAPVKVAVGLLISAVICLPSLYIFASLSGYQARLVEVCGLLAGLVTVTTLLLMGFAPVAWLFSQSTESVAWMGALHFFFWAISTIFAVRFLKAGFTRHQGSTGAGVNTWVIIFVLVSLQMTTALRPLVGTSEDFLPKEKRFFLTHWFKTMDQEMSRARHDLPRRD